MKRVLFLFSLILMLGVSVYGVAKETSYIPRIATVYQNVHEDLNIDCTSYNMSPFSHAYVTFTLQGDKVVRLHIGRENVEDLHNAFGDYYDLPVPVNGASSTEFNAYIRIVFVE